METEPILGGLEEKWGCMGSCEVLDGKNRGNGLR